MTIWNYPCTLSGVLTDVIASSFVHISASSAVGSAPQLIFIGLESKLFKNACRRPCLKLPWLVVWLFEFKFSRESFSPSLSSSISGTWKSSATHHCGVGWVSSPTLKVQHWCHIWLQLSTWRKPSVSSQKKEPQLNCPDKIARVVVCGASS